MENTINTTAAKPAPSIVYVDPAMAERWLEQNQGNRKMNEGSVRAYRRDMVEGRWVFDGSPIRFSADGRLLDGQHRLSALAGLDSSYQFPFLVVRGLEDQTQLVMDQGRRRITGEQLALYGYKYPNQIAAVFRLLLQCELGVLFKDENAKKAITNPMVVDYVESHQEQVKLFLSMLNTLQKVPAPMSAVGCSFLLCWQVDKEKAFEYFEGLATGAGLMMGSPALAVRTYLQNVRANRTRIRPRQVMEVIFRGFNATLDGRSMKGIYMKNYSEASFPWPGK